MNEQLSEQQLQRLSRQYLNDLVENLDKSTVIRLQHARQLALNEKSDHKYSSQWLSAFAIVMVMIVIFWQMGQQKTDVGEEFLAVEDLIQMEANQDLVNDLDFYQWLESQSKQGKLV